MGPPRAWTRMIDDLVKQVLAGARRLFSSKSNCGKQVSRLTERLHTLKQVVVAMAIMFILGYSQFRSHFKCRPNGNLDSKEATDFCLINGTATVVGRDAREAVSIHQESPSQFWFAAPTTKPVCLCH